MKFRFYFRLTTAFIKRFKALLFLGVILGVLVFLFINYLYPVIFKGTSQIIGVTGRFHPDSTSLPDFIVDKISDGLTKINDSGIPEPDLASSWETADNGRTWVFHLKSGKFWQDGREVDSSSINYDFSDATIERPNNKTIIFKLQNPYSPFPGVVSRPVFKRGLLGTGNWKVNKITIIAGYVNQLDIEDSNKNKITYKFYPTEDTTKLAFKLGQINEIQQVFDPTPIDKWNTIKVTKFVNKNQVVTIFFNTQDDLLKDKTVRQALMYAIDKDKLDPNRAFGPISSLSWAYNPLVKTYDFDQEKASDTISKLPDETKKNLNIKLVTSPILLSTAEEIEKDWNAVGVKTQVQISSIIPSQFQAYLTIFDIPPDPDQYSIWHSTQVQTNISGYSSPRIDKILESGRSTLDLEERKKIYIDFQRFILEDLPAAFLYYPSYYNILKR